jgi:hypothetical protein
MAMHMHNVVISLGIALSAATGWGGDLTPDFQLVDMNPNSARFNSPVSPRDYLLQVSGYYFAFAG